MRYKEIPSLKLITKLVIILAAIYLVLLHPITVRAAEKEPGGANNTVSVRSERIYTPNGRKFILSYDFKVSGNYEAVGYLNETTSIINLDVIFGKDGMVYTTASDITYDDFMGMDVTYEGDQSIQRSVLYDKDNLPVNISINYISKVEVNEITSTVYGLKIFQDRESAETYIKSGSLDGMINEDEVDSGSYDPDIGYLHNLKWLPLMYGEQDENGFYENYDDRFTWSDYYPEYDESYLVEVRASCEVEVKKWFGIGKSTVYNSDIRELATGVRYKDLEYIVSLNEQKSLFNDFINEHMPGNSSMSDVISAGTYRMDAFYFRIYKWDEEDETYKYGLWVRLTKDGSALQASLEFTADAGELDQNGKWKQNSDSDYGTGKRGSATTGAGDTLDDAKEEADQKQEDKDNGGKPIDLSNTNFQELWEWFCGQLEELWKGLGVIPEFFGRLFSFLPSPVILFIGLGIVIAIILRILGR